MQAYVEQWPSKDNNKAVRLTISNMSETDALTLSLMLKDLAKDKRQPERSRMADALGGEIRKALEKYKAATKPVLGTAKDKLCFDMIS